MQYKQTGNTVVTLANAGELVVNIARAVMGNEIADTFNGSDLSRELLHELAQTEFQANLSSQMGA